MLERVNIFANKYFSLSVKAKRFTNVLIVARLVQLLKSYKFKIYEFYDFFLKLKSPVS